MGLFRHHVLVCTQRKMEGIPQCAAVGGEAVLAALQREAKAAGIADEALITSVGCLGLCGRGPNVVVYPDNVWYEGVKESDVAEIVTVHLKGGKPVERLQLQYIATARKEILEHRKKVEAMKMAQEAAGLPPDEIMAMVRGFQEARILLSALELDVFTAIGDGRDAASAAKSLPADLRATAILLNALAAFKLLEKKGEVFFNTPVSKRFLMAGAPDDSRDALLHSANMWKRWHLLTEVVKTGKVPALEEMAKRDDSWTRTFIAAMHKNGAFRGGQVARLLDLKGVKKLLDLGGGSGAYSIAFCKANPALHAVVFDLPTVTPLTTEYAKAAGMDKRISTVSGDMRADPLGSDFDVVYISAICHMWSPQENKELFVRVREALAPGGRIVVQDFVLDSTKTKPRMGAVFAVNMLVGTKGGNSYSADEYFAWVKEAGFENPELIPMPGPNALVVARKA